LNQPSGSLPANQPLIESSSLVSMITILLSKWQKARDWSGSVISGWWVSCKQHGN